MQTAYGKKTSTINDLTRHHPESLGSQVLQQYVKNFFEYLDERIGAADETTLALLTNGLVVDLLAYDITRAYTSTKAKVRIPNIKALFPDQHSIRASFGEDLSQISVIGVDPGEHVSAAFCAINPKNPSTVSNLLVRRKALYQPVLSYRSALQKLKCHRPIFTDVSEIHGAMWARDSSSKVGTELPSTYDTIASFEAYFDQWLYVPPILQEFYACRKLKVMKWEMRKSLQAEYQWAVKGAMSLADSPQSSLFVYGGASFNSGTNLPSLHTTLKGKLIKLIFDWQSPQGDPACVFKTHAGAGLTEILLDLTTLQ
ncbi:MAG: hypothetical protein J3Q66DRAFT_442623 [Benniella sp.]|nr:MAG: hypothetical protein J3Q66DRAFT_442623 [Benniella sp.]